MFSGLRSVCVNLFRCRTDGNKANNKVIYHYYEIDLVVYHSYEMVLNKDLYQWCIHAYSQCTALKIWSAMSLIWFSEKGMNPFSFRKSYVLSPSSSNTMQTWPWWSNQSSIRTQALQKHRGTLLYWKKTKVFGWSKVFLAWSQILTIFFHHQANLSAQAHQLLTWLPHGSAQYFWWSSTPLVHYLCKQKHTRYAYMHFW